MAWSRKRPLLTTFTTCTCPSSTSSTSLARDARAAPPIARCPMWCYALPAPSPTLSPLVCRPGRLRLSSYPSPVRGPLPRVALVRASVRRPFRRNQCASVRFRCRLVVTQVVVEDYWPPASTSLQSGSWSILPRTAWVGTPVVLRMACQHDTLST